ncbi:myb-like protein F [Polistes fuscatus]|uniref:myb-like protein F n=1 Tax=Polistes fuscatus TaxID=30207 RepID=UPI001CA86E71|nr:myb-like protein F [Polistes fuscatus]
MKVYIVDEEKFDNEFLIGLDCIKEFRLMQDENLTLKETLEVNLSSLLKTAKAEISRKDRMIAELRKQVDDMTFRRGHFNKNVKDCNKSVQQLSEKNVHEYNHAKTYTENEKTLMPKLANFNSNNDKYDPVASNSSETNFQHFESVNFNQFNEDQTEDYEHLNNQFSNTKYHSKKLPVPHIASTTVYTERCQNKEVKEMLGVIRSMIKIQDHIAHLIEKKKNIIKKSSNDHNNYSKDSIEHYREKDKYSHKRNRSPVFKHSDRKYKHYDDRYNKDYRNKYRDKDRRRSSQDKEDNISIISDRSYKDKSRPNEKYGTTDFHSSKSRGNKYSSLHDTKSVLHERSRSKIKIRTNYKTDDRKYSKHKTYDRNSEDRESTPCERKDDTKFISEKNVNVETRKDSFKITFNQFEDKLKHANKVDMRSV